ncbi:MAG: hypothetical protein JNM33_05410 [Rubrivivax sp.]|nr:hypothetical protein [Rubrivivax sp.]
MNGITRWLGLALAAALGASQAADRPAVAGVHPAPAPCSEAWNRMIEARVGSGDGRGHGPDVGTDEWMSSVEFRLGVRGRPDIPARGSDAWCRYIDGRARAHPAPAASAAAKAQGPTFDCRRVERGSIESMICSEPELVALDRQLDGVYAAAKARAANQRPPVLRAEQRGWVKGRNDCWKAAAPKVCIRGEYVRRIAELQASYRLLPGRGPIAFACDGQAAKEVIVTHFATQPPTLVAGFGDARSIMFAEEASGALRYAGRNETFVEQAGVATITWGYGAPPMHCTPKP